MQEKNERLEHILDAIHCGTWEWNVVTNEVILDERWAEIIGYQLAELQPITTQTTIASTHPDDLALSSKRIQAHLEGKTERYISETRIKHKDGHWVWVLDTGIISERDKNGRPLKMFGARQDITAKKIAEEAYRNESERFKALVSASDTGVWEWNKTTGELWCSPEYFSMLGWCPEDFSIPYNLDNVWMKLLHPDDKEHAITTFNNYLASKNRSLYECEFRLRHADGNWLWVISRGRTLPDDNGNPTNLTVGAHINITSLKEAQNVANDSEQRLRLISDSIPDSMVFRLDCGLKGESRKFTYLSQGVQTLHGFSEEEAIANPNLLYQQISEEYRPILKKHEEHCIKSMEIFRQEAKFFLADDEERWILIISSPRYLENGHLVFDGIEIDITERKLQEDKISELNAKLELRVKSRTKELTTTLENLQRAQDELLQNEKLASLGALVAGVAHELNTPIGNALMVASSFEQAYKTLNAQLSSGLTRTALSKFMEEVNEGSNIIQRNLERSAELIRSFKQLAVDQTSYQRRKFDLKSLSHEIAVTLRPTLRKTPFELIDNFCTNVTFDSYPGPLGQVLINLINNAIVHAFEDRQRGNIELSSEHDDDNHWVHISVKDDGNGIPKTHLKKIFDPFFTTQLGKGGSGLGLHIVYSLVTGLLGGRIDVKTQKGEGTEFLLSLPLIAPHSTE